MYKIHHLYRHCLCKSYLSNKSKPNGCLTVEGQPFHYSYKHTERQHKGSCPHAYPHSHVDSDAYRKIVWDIEISLSLFSWWIELFFNKLLVIHFIWRIMIFLFLFLAINFFLTKRLWSTYKFDNGRGSAQFREEVASRFVLDDWLFKHEGVYEGKTHIT